jgi:adenylate cyclase
MPEKTSKKAPPASRSEERKQLQEMELLLRIAKQVAAIETLDELLGTIVEIASRETGATGGTLFLNDENTGELYSRILQGTFVREIRMPNTNGIAGHVFTTGEGSISHKPYDDPRFDRSVDQETGFITRSLLSAPVRSAGGQVIGVLQVVNKKRGKFTPDDLRRVEAMAEQSALTLKSAQFLERTKVAQEREMQLLDIVADVTAEFDLGLMLNKIVGEAARMLDADRASLFLYDEKTGELFSRVATGESVGEIRIPSHAGIAGAVYTSGKTINIPYAYADLRFNPALDRRTGYFTRSLLCVPITDKAGKVIGVSQVLNKRGGPFTRSDESRLRAFTAQLAISLQNAKLLDDVRAMKNYNESMLQSMSTGVITLDENGRIVTCNNAGLELLRAASAEIVGQTAQAFFSGPNSWIEDRIKSVGQNLVAESMVDAPLTVADTLMSVNLAVLPLMAEENSETKKLGTLLMIEDISTEKRMKSTMSRYMDPVIADQILQGGQEALGGKSVIATVLFSDIRNFTTISEELGPHPTVTLLNEYFTIMVDCIQKQGGMLDKFIGDAVMAVFGLPVGHDDDEDRGVRAAVAMITELRRWNLGRTLEGKRPLEIGIGINTDTVVSGNIGAPKRMDYTIIGDGVNLASRIESACKQYSARIMISEHTYRKLRGTYRMREVDHVVVKGKHEPVALYEVLDYHTDESFPNMQDSIQNFNAGLAHYRNARWEKATAAFEASAALNPQDSLPSLYIERCQHLTANPPGDSWNGVWVLKSK